MVFGLFMFGFDGDDEEVFQEPPIQHRGNYDAVAYSVLTPYPGTLTWYEMKKADRIVSYDWEKYDQANVVYRPAQMSGEQLRLGHIAAYETFYSPSSIARRFPLRGRRSRTEWSIYNLFMKRARRPTARPRSRRRPRRRCTRRCRRSCRSSASGATRCWRACASRARPRRSDTA